MYQKRKKNCKKKERSEAAAAVNGFFHTSSIQMCAVAFLSENRGKFVKAGGAEISGKNTCWREEEGLDEGCCAVGVWEGRGEARGEQLLIAGRMSAFVTFTVRT